MLAIVLLTLSPNARPLRVLPRPPRASFRCPSIRHTISSQYSTMVASWLATSVVTCAGFWRGGLFWSGSARAPNPCSVPTSRMLVLSGLLSANARLHTIVALRILTDTLQWVRKEGTVVESLCPECKAPQSVSHLATCRDTRRQRSGASSAVCKLLSQNFPSAGRRCMIWRAA